MKNSRLPALVLLGIALGGQAQSAHRHAVRKIHEANQTELAPGAELFFAPRRPVEFTRSPFPPAKHALKPHRHHRKVAEKLGPKQLDRIFGGGYSKD